MFLGEKGGFRNPQVIPTIGYTFCGTGGRVGSWVVKMESGSGGVMGGHRIARGGECPQPGLVALLRLVPLRGTQLRREVAGTVESAPTAHRAELDPVAEGGWVGGVLPS